MRFVHISGSLLLILLSACNREPRPVYNRLRTQLVQKAFRDLAENEPRENILQLQKLADIYANEAFYRMAQERELERLTRLELNQWLLEGDMLKIEAWMQGSANVGYGVALREQVQGFIRAARDLQQYRKQEPFTTSSEAQAALQQVLQQRTILASVPGFDVWLQAQEQKIEVLQQEERRAELSRMLQNYDRAWIAGTSGAAALEQQIRSFAPEHLFVQLVKLIDTNNWLDFERLLETEFGDAESAAEELRSLEQAACRGFDQFPVNIRKTLSELLDGTEAVSLSGLWLRVRLAAARGDWKQAHEWLHMLTQTSLPAQKHLTELMTQALLPREQFTAKCWRPPFPAITDILNRITQLRVEERKKDRHP